MADRLGPLWFGDPAGPDEDTATQPAHAAALTDTLTSHGHLTPVTDPTARLPVPDEPPEADLARRAPRPRPVRQSAQHHRGEPAGRRDPLIHPAPGPGSGTAATAVTNSAPTG
jgi:hypothetical protein